MRSIYISIIFMQYFLYGLCRRKNYVRVSIVAMPAFRTQTHSFEHHINITNATINKQSGGRAPIGRPSSALLSGMGRGGVAAAASPYSLSQTFPGAFTVIIIIIIIIIIIMTVKARSLTTV